MLGSIIAAEGVIASVVGMMQMNPLVKDPHEYYSTVDSSVVNYFVVLHMTPILPEGPRTASSGQSH